MNSTSEINELCRASSCHGPSAWVLLNWLRDDFAEHCAQGGSFTITPKVLERENYIPCWPRRRYERARDVLLQTGYITKVGCAPSMKGRRAVLYTLTAKGIYPPSVRREYRGEVEAALCLH